MDVTKEVLAVIDETLGLGGRAKAMKPGSALIGAIPELDSMAVANVIQALEDRFGFVVDDDEIDGSAFETVGSLVAFVDGKLAAARAASRA